MPVVGAETLARNVREFARVGVPGEYRRLVTAVALELQRRLILKTPRDTGRAAGNWQLSRVNPIRSVLPAEGQTRSESVRLELSKSQDRMAAFQAGQTVFVANNVEYVQYLNQGTSSQAPAMFVEAAIDEVNSTFRSRRVVG